MPTDTVSIAEFIKSNRIRMTAERTDSNPSMDDSANMDHWKCLLRAGNSRKAEKTFKTIEHQAKRLRNFLGDSAYETLLWNTERL